MTSFQSDTSLEQEAEYLSSLAMVSSSFLTAASTHNRVSQSTFFSASSNDSREASHSRKESSILETLERLQQAPPREEVTSQDFIDWPYSGWEAKASKLGTAR
jgi:hypothetical protein